MWNPAARFVSAGLFDLDHLRTKVGEVTSTQRRRGVLSDLDNAQAGQWPLQYRTRPRRNTVHAAGNQRLGFGNVSANGWNSARRAARPRAQAKRRPWKSQELPGLIVMNLC